MATKEVDRVVRRGWGGSRSASEAVEATQIDGGRAG